MFCFTAEGLGYESLSILRIGEVKWLVTRNQVLVSPPMSAFKEIEARPSGKVQGVLFRDFVKKKASALFLTGYVENTPQGSMYVLAQGREENLEKLIEHLHKGPFGARVSRVDVEWKEPTEEFPDFSIIY